MRIKIVEPIIRTIDNAKKAVVDKARERGAKMAKAFVENLIVTGSGSIKIEIGEIKISGVDLGIKILDGDNQNRVLAEVSIPIDVSIKPGVVEIPISVDGGIK